METLERLYTVEEVAAKYRFTTETVWKKCRMEERGDAKGWPHKREGRTIRFTAENISEIDNRMNPAAPARIPAKRKRQPLSL